MVVVVVVQQQQHGGQVKWCEKVQRQIVVLLRLPSSYV
jgi:hypothetical protein